MKKKIHRRRSITAFVFIVLVVLAILYARCAGGFGFGKGDGDGDSKTQTINTETQPVATPVPAVPVGPPCELRLDGEGLSHAGNSVTVAEAIELCRTAKKANLTVTGDSTYGKLVEIREALEAAGISVLE